MLAPCGWHYAPHHRLYAPVQNAEQVTRWLRAEIISSVATTALERQFVTAWEDNNASDIVLTYLAGKDYVSPQQISQLTSDSFTSNLKVFDTALRHLINKGGITRSHHVTTAIQIAGRYGLSINDLRHLRRCLQFQFKNLSWLDFLLVAASTPDFPTQIVANLTNNAFIARKLESLPSSLLQPEMQKQRLAIGITLVNIPSLLPIALIGYLVTRGWSSEKIALALNIAISVINQVISELRSRIRALFDLANQSNLSHNPRTTRVQVLWHMLTGIAPQYVSLAALPNVRHWVLRNLINAGITTLTALIQLTPEQYPTTINAGLMRKLQEQAVDILIYHASEAAFVESFTNRFSLVGERAVYQQVA